MKSNLWKGGSPTHSVERVVSTQQVRGSIPTQAAPFPAGTKVVNMITCDRPRQSHAIPDLT